MSEIIKLPFYAKLALVLLSLISLCSIFYIAQDILIPILMSVLFAILLRPIALFFKTKLRFPHVLAVMLTVLLFVLIILGIFTFLSFQISTIVDDFDKIKENITIHFGHIQEFIKENFEISSKEQNKYLDSATKDSVEKGKEIIGTTLLSFTDTLLNLILIPIYTFLILLYRNHFILFLAKLFKPEYHLQLHDILTQVKVAVKSYIVGLIIEMIAVSVLTTLGFMIIGVQICHFIRNYYRNFEPYSLYRDSFCGSFKYCCLAYWCPRFVCYGWRYCCKYNCSAN